MRKLRLFSFLALLALGCGSLFGQAGPVSWTSAYLTDLNFNTQYPCGNPTQTGATGQVNSGFLQAAHYGGGGVSDWTCYEQDFSITADIFSPYSANILIYLGEHTVTVNANATIPSNFMICAGPGGSIVAGGGFTLTNNAQPCFGGGGGGSGLTRVGLTMEDVIYETAVTNSPITPINQGLNLLPVLKVQNAGYALMGPRLSVPGKAIITAELQSTFFIDPSNVTSFSVTFTDAIPGSNRVLLNMGCYGNDANIGTPVITDSQGNTWSTFINDGPNGQALSGLTAGGAETINVALTYGGGQSCTILGVWAQSVLGLTGNIDDSKGGQLLNNGGSFDIALNTSATSDFVSVQTETNGTGAAPFFGSGPPIVNVDNIFSNPAAGQAIYGDSFTTGPGSYAFSVTVSGGIGTYSSLFAVAWETGGLITPTAKPTFRPFTCGDFDIAIASLVCSPFLVLDDQPNTYTSSSKPQDFTLSQLYLPNSFNATVSHMGEIAEDSNNGQISVFLAGGLAWIASMPHNFNPGDGNGAVWFNEGGVIQLRDGGTPSTVIANVETTVTAGLYPANSCTDPPTTISMPGVIVSPHGSGFGFTAQADPTAIPGWGSTGGLQFSPWPTADHVNFRLCNPTGSDVTTTLDVTFNVFAK